MNISLKNEVIWLSPENTGGEILSKIFQNYDFFVFDQNKNLNTRLISLSDVSWTSKIPENFINFKKIVTLRNPYERVYRCYENLFSKSIPVRDLNKIKLKFNGFLNKCFVEKNLETQLDPFFLQDSWLSKWNLTEYLPDEILRYENLESDVLKLSFVIKNGVKFDIDQISKIKSQNSQEIDIREIYYPENARKVFQYFKNYFFFLGYDPYSFTNQNLSDDDKINFIHNRF